jgi:hypothetical protein
MVDISQHPNLPITRPIEGPSAWNASDLIRDRGWLIEVDKDQADEIAAATDAVLAQGLRAGEFTKNEFPLPKFAAEMQKMLHNLQNGSGLAVLRGLPIDSQGEERAAVTLWGLGTYLGRGLKQSAGVNLGRFRDNLVAHIVDQRHDPNNRNVHGSATGAEQEPHCDPSDLVGLMCIRPALDGGGVSRVVSAISIFNHLLKTNPGVLPMLFRGFYNDLRDEGKNGVHVTSTPISVYGYAENHLSVCFNSKTVILAAERDGRGLTPEEEVALNAMLETARSPTLVHEMTLKTGDVQFLNNYTMLHSRTAWADPPEIDRRRCMLRIWLRTENPRPLPDGFAGGYLSGVQYDVGEQAMSLTQM